MIKFNYIDTLYLSKNSEDYSDYLNSVSYILSLAENNNATFLGYAGGRTWYQFPIFRVGIMDYETSKKSNNFQFLLQYSSTYLMKLGYEDPTYKSIETIFDSPDTWEINRIDMTEINTISLLDRIPLSSFRKKTYIKSGSDIETLYLGNRKNGNVFRAYNKSIELEKKQSFDKMEFLSTIFDLETDTLYTYELELHRKWLKDKAQLTSFSDLEKVFVLWGKIVGNIKWVVDSPKNVNLIANNHNNRIDEEDIFILAEYKEFDYKPKIRKKKPSKHFMFDSINRMIEKYNKAMQLAVDNGVKGAKVQSTISLLEDFIEYREGHVVEFTVEEFDNYFEFIRILKEKANDFHNDVLISQSREAFDKANIQGFRGLF